MKSKLVMIAAMLLTVMLTTYPEYLNAGSNIEKTWKGSPNSRTWVVSDFPVGPPDDFHLAIGDAFRIQGMGTHIQLVPLKRLAKRWHRSENSFIPLKSKGIGKQKLCGRFDLDLHQEKSPQQHFILIEESPHEENTIVIIITDDNDFDCNKVTHGGTAHAQN